MQNVDGMSTLAFCTKRFRRLYISGIHRTLQLVELLTQSSYLTLSTFYRTTLEQFSLIILSLLPYSSSEIDDYIIIFLNFFLACLNMNFCSEISMQTFFLHDQTILYSFYKYNGQAILGILRIFCLASEELLHNFAHDYCFYGFQL